MLEYCYHNNSNKLYLVLVFSIFQMTQPRIQDSQGKKQYIKTIQSKTVKNCIFNIKFSNIRSNKMFETDYLIMLHVQTYILIIFVLYIWQILK